MLNNLTKILCVFLTVLTVGNAKAQPTSAIQVQETNDAVVFNNNVLKATISKESGYVLSLLVDGVEAIATTGSKKYIYYDFPAAGERLSNMHFSIAKQTDTLVDISFKRAAYSAATRFKVPCDVEIHYVLKKGDRGLYTYSVLEHQPDYPKFELDIWRLVLWLGKKPNGAYLCEKIYADSLRSWTMPSEYDYSKAETTPIKEILKMTTGARNGQYDGKYQYTLPYWDSDVYGHTSDSVNMGTWAVLGSHEYFNDGPYYHELNAADGIVHVILKGTHYNAGRVVVQQGQHWRKMYGPFLLYFSNKKGTVANLAGARLRAEKEKAAWPYNWVDNPEYPLAAKRGTVTGVLQIKDAHNSRFNSAGAWVGVVQLSDTASNPQQQFQFEGSSYQYWVKTNAGGAFTIPNIRPGKYHFYAIADGATGEYKQANVEVKSGATTALGNIKWTTASKGKLYWEIGVANRKASEFKLGDLAYSDGFTHERFNQLFSNPIQYHVADKNWGEVLPYAHSPYTNADGTLSPWRWDIHFNLPASIPTKGNAILTIAYAGSHNTGQAVYVNDTTQPFISFKPDNNGGNALLRQSNYAKYAVHTVSIPWKLLHPGSNTISLATTTTKAMAQHLMFDYIKLEGE